MKDPNRFYTYAYLREDRTPYYIGKGCARRIYENNGRPCSKPKDKSRIIFLKQNLTEEEAFKHEKYMIAVFGRIDLGTGILHNKTDGGEGCSGLVHSEETKKIMSQAKKGKSQSEESNKKRSEALKGIKRSEETKKKFREAKKGTAPSEKTRNRHREVLKGAKWWNDGNGNTKMSKECPGPNWVLGRGEPKKTI
jgi:hypothetical protein